MNIFGALATVIVGYMGIRKGEKLAEEWFRQGMSLFGTVLIAFLGFFGAAGLAATQMGYTPMGCFMFALFTAAGGTAAAVLALWKRSSLLKGIPVLSPMQVEKAVLETGFVYTEPSLSDGGKK